MPGNNVIHVAPEKKPENPLLRGFGCIVMLLLPLVSFGLTLLFGPMIAATGLVPYQLLGYLSFPVWVAKVPVLRDLAGFMGGLKDLGLNLILFFVILLLLAGISSFVYVAILQIIGPPRYGEKDAVPSSYKAKKYTR